jgi:hypothetical protein
MNKKQYAFTLDFKNASSIDLPNIVSGDTGNEFIITVTNGGNPVDLTGARVRLIIVNKDGPGSQDSDVEGSDIDMTRAADGVVAIDVHSPMISNGLNVGCIEAYTGANHEIQNTTQNFNFTAKLSPSERASLFPSLLIAEARYQAIIAAVQEALESIVCVSGAHIDASGHLIIELDNGTEVDVGMIGIYADNVRFTPQTNSAARKAAARSNIGAASDAHVHGSITNDGKIADHPLHLVETDENSNIFAKRRIVVDERHPSEVEGLLDGDLYIRPDGEAKEVVTRLYYDEDGDLCETEE